MFFLTCNQVQRVIVPESARRSISLFSAHGAIRKWIMREEVHKLALESRVRVVNYCQRAANFVHSVAH